MLTEIAAEEYRATLDRCVEDLLWEAGVDRPPGTSRCSVDSGVTGQGAIVGRRLRTTVTENR